MVSRDFRPLLACSSLFWRGRLGCRPQLPSKWFRANSLAFRRSRCGFARIPASSGLFWGLWLRAATVAVVWREFRCVLKFRRSRCGFARIPASSRLFLGGPCGRRTRWGGAWPSFQRSRCGFARTPLRFDAPAVVSREFRCVSMLPLWFRAKSGFFWRLLASSGGPLRLRAATAHAVVRCLRFDAPAVVSREFLPVLACSDLFWGAAFRLRAATAHAGCGFARLPLRFDAPAVVLHEFRCVSMLPLWFRADSVAFRCSRCGFARVPASSGVFWPLLGGPLRLLAATAHAVGRSTLPLWFRASFFACRRSRCGFARFPLRFDAPAVLGGRLGCAGRNGARGGAVDAPAVVSRKFRCVSTLSLWFRANSVAFRCSRCGFARLPLRFDASAVVSHEFRCVSMLPLWFRANSGASIGSDELLYFWSPGVSVIFRGLFWPPLASSGPPHCLGSTPA